MHSDMTSHHQDTKAPGIEQRRFERHAFEVELSAQWDHQFFTGFTENISAGGLFIATHDIQPLGTRFRIAFTVPEIGRTFEPMCEVRWHRPVGAGGTGGMGVNFIDLSAEEQDTLDEVLRHAETLFYDD